LLAVVSEAVITFAGEPPTQALVDTLVMSAALGTAAVLQVHSAAEQSRLVDRLAAIARVDALTGLASRRSLDAELADALSGGPDRRRSGESDGTALLLVDLDFFKSVNDEHGHPVGDDYLVHVAAFLSSRFRSQDVVARLGGDEFAVLMRRSSRTDAFAVAQGLLAAAPAHPLVLGDGTRLPLRFTVGVGHVQPDDEPSVRDLYADADRALYTAKQAGRGQVR
jgi:diguanylate cyclase (GGDEF)-like protein